MNNQANLIAVNKKFSSRMQARLLLVFCLVSLLLVSLMGRLIYIMQADGDRYAKSILSRQSYISSVLPYKRGDILDRNGTVLARSELQYRLILDPKLLNENEESIEPTLTALKDNFGINTDDVHTVLKDKADSQYVILQKNVKYDAVEAYKEATKDKSDICGVWFEEEYVRSYPNNALACDVLGFTSADNQGYFGIEEYYNSELNGTNGREYGYYDSSLNIERIVEKPENGNSIVSTINADVQRIIQKDIVDFNTEFGSLNLGILVMDPNNGEILAMASNHEYDLNNPRSLDGIYTPEEIAAMTDEQKTEALNAMWKNDVISYGYEPGSTFKPFTVAAGLEENVISDSDTFLCDGGEAFGSTYIKCSKVTGHGTITLGEALMKSCNDALMQIVAREGKNIFYNYQNSFGFGKKTGVDLPGEETGLIIGLDNLNATELATSCFGQSLNVTMVQMAAAYSSLVNGGYYYQPHVVKQIINDSGATVKQFDKVLVRQTVSEQTSELIQKYMYQTVEEGTAKPAQVPGYAIGGKTGTAQKLPRKNKKYLVSFLGAVPATNPQMVIYIIVDEPQNVVKQDDSSIATKLASKVMTEILPVLGIYPEGDIDYLLQPEETQDGQAGNTENGSAGQEGNTDTENNPDNSGTQDTVNPSNEGENQDNQGDIQNTADNQDTENQQEDNTQDSDNPDNSGNEENTPDGSDLQNELDNGTDNPAQADNQTQDSQNNTNPDGSGTQDDDFNGDAID